jgi:uncharacterized membrane protein
MANTQDVPKNDQSPADEKPKRSRLRRILDENPEARPRIGKAVAALLGSGLVTLLAVGALLVWHIRRRAAFMRERLSPPRILKPLEIPGEEPDPTT